MSGMFFFRHTVVPSKRQGPKPIKLLIGNGGSGAILRTQSTVHTLYNDLCGSMGNRGGDYLQFYIFVPIPAHTTLPPNANFGLSDCS